jgi:hypothetical protein
MKIIRLPRAVYRGVLAVPLVLVVAAVTPAAPADPAHRQTTYEVTNLESFGGSASGNSINNRGWIAGFSTEPVASAGCPRGHLEMSQRPHPPRVFRRESTCGLAARGGERVDCPGCLGEGAH